MAILVIGGAGYIGSHTNKPNGNSDDDQIYAGIGNPRLPYGNGDFLS